MGKVTRILITGAAGFVGRACVAEARLQGLDVVAVVRGNAPGDWAADPGITAIRADLAMPDSVDILRHAMPGVTAVIHAAAHLGGDAAQHGADTLNATAHVMQATGQARLVLVSSIAVYDTMRLSPGDALTESTPLENPDQARDAYTAAKLRQEALCQKVGSLWIMRPGAIYGPGRTWHALNGFWAGKLHVQIGSEGHLPLCHVDHVARALVQAALTDPGGQQVLNVIDDDLPTRAQLLRAHKRLTGWPRLSLTVPYRVWLIMARMLKPLGDARPGLLREPILRARLMPLRYPNTALRNALGGQDAAPFEDMLARSLEGAA